MMMVEHPTPAEAEAQQQASDSFVLQRAKELLRTLQVEGRITKQLYYTGVWALSAAAHVVETPGVKRINQGWGKRLAQAQDQRAREAKDVEF
jgi:hypothetical protein